MTTSAIKLNLNDRVRVKLTDHGREILRKDYEERFAFLGRKYVPPKEDAEGWSEWQLWNLFQDFGQHIYLGGKLPFDTIIQFEEQK